MKDNVINLEQYRATKQERQNPTAEIEERLTELDYPTDTVESVKKYADILADKGMTNHDVIDTILGTYDEMLDTPYDEKTDSLENLTHYREDKQRELGSSAINDIYVIYGGGEQQSVPVHTSRNHLKVVDNSID